MKKRASRLIAIWAGLVGFTIFAGTAVAETITVKDTQGRSMDVVVTAYTASSGNVQIRRTDGKVFNVTLDLFDAPSQELIVANAPKARADMRIDVSVGRRRSRQGDSSYMKDQTISASVKLENESRDVDLSSGKGTLFLIARQTRRYADDDADYGKILSKQSFEVAIPAGEDYEYEAKPVITSYDSDRDSSNIGGWEYYGYLFILQDEDGEIHSALSSIGNLSTEMETTPGYDQKLLALKEDQLVEKNLEVRTTR